MARKNKEIKRADFETPEAYVDALIGQYPECISSQLRPNREATVDWLRAGRPEDFVGMLLWSDVVIETAWLDWLG